MLTFYKSMLLGEDEDMPHYERSVKAHQDSVQKLRREKRVSLELRTLRSIIDDGLLTF